MEMWPHQRHGVNAFLAAVARGGRRICLHSPTGGGKSRMICELASEYVDRGMKCVLYTNRRMLLDQLSGTFAGAGLEHGIRAAGHAGDAAQLLQVSSVQTELSRKARRSATWQPAPAHLVLVDEAHLMATGATLSLLQAHVDAGAVVGGLTATPINIGHFYDELIVAGVTSELRQCGALVACRHYGCDEPDLSKIGRISLGEDLTEQQNVKAIMTPTIFARVVENYNRLNPDRRPAILFAPGVKESLWFAEQFSKAGIPAAHIDGEDTWVDGELAPTTKASRDQIREWSKDGRIKVVCNRFVLREGIDIPWLCHGIFATIFGSLQTYLQCLDAESEVLTARGFVGPDSVRDDDLVAGFDTTNGAIEWVPITARVDRPLGESESMYAVRGPSVDIRVSNLHRMVHKVRTTDENGSPAWPTAWQVKTAEDLSGYWSFQIPVCGRQQSDGVPLSDAHLRFIGWFLSDGTRNRANRQVVITQAVHQPQIHDLRACLKECEFDFKEYTHIPTNGFPNGKTQIRFCIPKGGKGGSLARRGWGPFDAYLDKNLSPLLDGMTERQLGVLLEAVHLGDGSKKRTATWVQRSYHISTGNRVFADRLQSLCVRRGYRCSISVEKPSNISRKPRLVVNIKKADSIHLGGSAQADRTTLSPTVFQPGERIWCVSNRLGTLVVRRNGKVAVVGNSGGRLLRASPKTGKTVAVIQDHGGNWHRHGSLNADRVWDMSLTPGMISGMREERMRKKEEKEPFLCPKCAQILMTPKCPCGFTVDIRKKSRPVIQSDGTLREHYGDIYRPRVRREQADTAAEWVKIYHRSRKSGMTFRQAEGLFLHEHGYYPPRDLPFMPVVDVDWFRKVKDVPRGDLVEKRR